METASPVDCFAHRFLLRVRVPRALGEKKVRRARRGLQDPDPFLEVIVKTVRQGTDLSSLLVVVRHWTGSAGRLC
jgi:hypothetical protein